MSARLRRGSDLLRQGRMPEAADVLQRLVDDAPHLADAWYNLGYARRRSGDYDAALAAYDRALGLGAAAPEQIHLNRAAILSEHLQQYRQAEDALHSALRARPGYPAALLNLGNLHEERGQRAPAVAAYRALLASTDPEAAALAIDAHTRLLHLEPPERLDDPRIAQLRRYATSPAIEQDRRASALYALAHACDRLGGFDAAFAFAADANRCAHGRQPRYLPERTQARFADIARVFARPRPAGAAPGGVAPLFVCGMFRSGSSLIEQVLAQHPRIRAGGELDVLPRLAARRLAPFPAAAAAWSEAEFDALADDYRRRTAALLAETPQARYLTDKRPDNFALIGLIKRMFPDARIVHTCRHPLDNGLSIFMQHLDPRQFGYAGALSDIGHYYGAYRRLMAHWTRIYPDSIHHFDYDAFVAAPEPTLRALLAFLELPWDPACLEFHRSSAPVRTGSYWQVRQPLHRAASGRWRMYRAHLLPLVQALGAAGVEID
ncbi:MAG TPA: cytochrome c biogenesis factor [Xanthomonadaceae bacterium]|nr:cytochrome c biogenesis factor [Xanthomonadaceae bacterium]